MADEASPCIIAIIGAGVAGPVLALTILSHPILRQRYRPIIYERLPDPGPASLLNPPGSEDGNKDENVIGTGDHTRDTYAKASYAAGAAVALTSNALFPLYCLGLRPVLDAISCETTRIQIWRAWAGKEGGEHQFYNQINHPNWQEDLGTCLRVVERAQLQRLVLGRVRELGGDVVWGKRLLGIRNMEQGGVKMSFEGGEEAVAGLVVGADGGWSAVRRHIIMSDDGQGGDDAVKKDEDRWKPDFADADGIYGVSGPIETSSSSTDGAGPGDQEASKAGDTHWVLLDTGTASTWTLPGGRQFWTISFSSAKPPKRGSKIKETQTPKLAKLYGADVTLGGHSLEETEEILKKYENAWHPVAGRFGELFQRSERIVRAPLWYRAWEQHEIGGRNTVVIGDAARLMLPSSGQGAGFAIEDATILADQLLNHPPSSTNGTLDFSRAIIEYVQSRVPRSKSMVTQSYWTAVLGLANRWWWRWLRDSATKWMPMSGDPKAQGKKAKDPMAWLYEVRYKVGQAENVGGVDE